MSAFEKATLRLQLPEERILKCSAARGKMQKKDYTAKIRCEKPALHGFGCLLTATQRLQALENGDPSGLVHLIKREATRHAGRSAIGKWYFWEES